MAIRKVDRRTKRDPPYDSRIVIAHLALDATMIAAITTRLNALFQYFINDDLPNLRPSPLGGKPGIGEFSGELLELYV